MNKNIIKRGAKLMANRSYCSISVSENNRKFTVVVNGDGETRKIHIDEEPYRSMLKSRCDYAIEVFNNATKRAFFFVELKGDDIVKAASQIAYTVEHLSDYRYLLDYMTFSKRYACIVASHGMKPAILTRYQVFAQRIEKCGFEKLKCKTHQLTAKLVTGGEVLYE